MPTVKENIMICMNNMRNVVLNEKATVTRLRNAAVANKATHPNLEAALDAVIDEPFHPDNILYILTIIRNDIWKHRRALGVDKKGKPSLDRSLVRDPDVLGFWDLLLPEQQDGLLRLAYSLITVISPLAEKERWDELDDTWEKPTATKK